MIISVILSTMFIVWKVSSVCGLRSLANMDCRVTLKMIRNQKLVTHLRESQLVTDDLNPWSLSNRGLTLQKDLDRIFLEEKPFPRGICDSTVSLLSPEEQALPFQNHQKVVSEYCEKILADNFCRSDKYPRAIHGITSGPGCGKTRVLEECRLYFDKHFPDVLCIAISYDPKRRFHEPVRLINDVNKDPSISLIYSVIVRMLAVYYGQLPSDVSSRLTESACISRHFKRCGCIGSSTNDLLEGTILHLVRKQEKEFQTKINHFVLQIDHAEIPLLAISQAIKQEKKRKKKNPYLISHSLPSYDHMMWYLSSSCFARDLGGVEGHVVMSSVDFTLLNSRWPRRLVLALECAKIDPVFAVDMIWKRRFEGSKLSLFLMIRSKLLILAAAVNSIPKLVECVDTALRVYLEDYNDTVQGKEQLNDFLLFITQFLKKEAISKNYSGAIRAEELFPLFFPRDRSDFMEEYTLDFHRMIEKAIYTNSVEEFCIRKEIPVQMTSGGCLYRLLSTNSIFSKVQKTFHQLLLFAPEETRIDKKRKKRKEENDIERRDRLLSTLLLQWLEMKSRLLLKAGHIFHSEHLQLSDFFGIRQGRLFLLSRKLFQDYPNLQSTKEMTIIKNPLPSSISLRNHPSTFFSSLNTLSPSSSAITLIQACKGDCFDLILILRRTTNAAVIDPIPVVLFLNTRSSHKDIFIDLMKLQPKIIQRRQEMRFYRYQRFRPTKRSRFRLTQYRKFQKQLEQSQDSFPTNPLSAAIQAKSFLYFYVTGYSFEAAWDLQEVDEHCYLLGEEEVKRGFLLLKDIVKTACTSYDTKPHANTNPPH